MMVMKLITKALVVLMLFALAGYFCFIDKSNWGFFMVAGFLIYTIPIDKHYDSCNYGDTDEK